LVENEEAKESLAEEIANKLADAIEDEL